MPTTTFTSRVLGTQKISSKPCHLYNITVAVGTESKPSLQHYCGSRYTIQTGPHFASQRVLTKSTFCISKSTQPKPSLQHDCGSWYTIQTGAHFASQRVLTKSTFCISKSTQPKPPLQHYCGSRY